MSGFPDDAVTRSTFRKAGFCDWGRDGVIWDVETLVMKIFQTLTISMQTQVAFILVVLMMGCGEDELGSDKENGFRQSSYQSSYHGPTMTPYTGGNVAYHSYTGSGISPSYSSFTPPYYGWVAQPQMTNGGMVLMSPSVGGYNRPNLNVLHDYASRINGRRAELDRLLHELNREQHNFNVELQNVAAHFEESRRAVAMEYNSLNSLMRSVAPIQLNNPPEGVYVNAYTYPQVQWGNPNSFTNYGTMQPFVYTIPQAQPVAQTVVMITSTPNPPIELMTVTTAWSSPTSSIVPSVASAAINHPIIPDNGLFISSLLQYIETCLSLVRVSAAGSNLVAQLERIKSSVLSIRGVTDTDASERLVTLSREVNDMLPRINALPRKTISEVWIDPLRVSSRDERTKLDRLVQQEMSVTVSVSDSAGLRDEEIHIESSIPNMFTIASNARTSHHRLKVLLDSKSMQLKLVAVCHQREFHKHSEKERWFFAFTCDVQGSAIRALADPGRNRLTQSILKVVCHSKEFARRLVLEKIHREDRCRLSKWSTIARGVPEPRFSKFDRRGREIWRSLLDRRGCFGPDESSIHSRCNTKP